MAPNCGVEIAGVDLADCSNAEMDAIKNAIYEHGVAYESLPDELKEEIVGLEAFHTADHVYQADGLYAQTDIGNTLRGQEVKTGAVHPVVIRHPCSGSRCRGKP